MTTPECYGSQFIVRYGYCDQHGRMTLSYLLKEAQQAAMEHCDELGIGLKYLLPRKRAFLLARQKAEIVRMPEGGERVRIETRPRCCGFLYPRRTVLRSLEGETLASIDARWVLIDTDTWRILRRAPEEMADMFPPEKPAPEPKLPPLLEPEKSLETRVPLHMTDSNHHLNNASYADILVDLLEERLLAGETVRGLDICYHRELRTGETFTLRSQTLSDGSVRIDGVKGELCHFESQVFF